MRFYPFGSGSVPSTVESSSFADYAEVTRFASSVLSASLALSGSIGPQGPSGSCIYISGSSGSQGPSGSIGPVGSVFGPV